MVDSYYVKVKNDVEAQEVVDLSVELGAELADMVKYCVGYNYWGVSGAGLTYAEDNTTHFGENANCYTLPQLRELVANKKLLDMVGETFELAEDTEFMSLHTGDITWKVSGTKVIVVGTAKRIDNDAICVTLQCADDPSCGFCTGNAELLIQPIQSERDKFIDAVELVLNKAPNGATLDEINTMVGKLYDAAVQGKIKLPKAKQS